MAMATHIEMLKFARNIPAVRTFAQRLLALPSADWTDWETNFLASMATYAPPRDPSTRAQDDIILTAATGEAFRAARQRRDD
jgi:hypothetical protein